MIYSAASDTCSLGPALASAILRDLSWVRAPVSLDDLDVGEWQTEAIPEGAASSTWSWEVEGERGMRPAPPGDSVACRTGAGRVPQGSRRHCSLLESSVSELAVA